MNKLVLFDVDRTLIKGLKAHKEAFSEAVKKVYGIDTSIDILEYHGMTDKQLIIEVLKKVGVSERKIKPKVEECAAEMVASFKKLIGNDNIAVLYGVRRLLALLEKNNVLMGLVTGNLEAIARGKMKKIGLNHYFKIGGFGSDDFVRAKLVKIAIKRAKKIGFSGNVFLIGDTPRDIVAGKKAGVKTIGVTTGIYSAGQLKNAGADFIFKDLKKTNEVLKIIL